MYACAPVSRCQNEVDDSSVVRIAIFFNEAVDIGVAMRGSGLPVGPEDLIKEIKVDLRCGLSLLGTAVMMWLLKLKAYAVPAHFRLVREHQDQS
jgi:hypothetical protein